MKGSIILNPLNMWIDFLLVIINISECKLILFTTICELWSITQNTKHKTNSNHCFVHFSLNFKSLASYKLVLQLAKRRYKYAGPIYIYLAVQLWGVNISIFSFVVISIIQITTVGTARRSALGAHRSDRIAKPLTSDLRFDWGSYF